MKFIIEETEAKRILLMHQSLKEQVATPTKTLEEKLQDLVDNGCVSGGTVVPMSSTNPPNMQYAIRKNSVNKPGTIGYFFIDYSLGEKVGQNGEFKMVKGKWGPCKKRPTPVPAGLQTNPILTPEQQKEVDDLIAYYPTNYRKDKPSADQIGKGEWEEVQLNTEPGFQKLGLPDDYKIWKKTGKRQSEVSPQEGIIQEFIAQGWDDKFGGKINPAIADKYIIKDLSQSDNPEIKLAFPTRYIIVKPITSLDVNTLVKEITALVNTNNYNDRKTCKDIIEKYSAAKEKSKTQKIPVTEPELENWKIGVNTCIANKLNYADLGITNNKITSLQTVTPTTGSTTYDRWSLK